MGGSSADGKSKTALRAVMFADAVEYSRLVLENESAALELMRQCFKLFRGLAVEHGGALVKTTGDGVVLAFDSAVAAVACAIAAHRELRSLNRPLHERRQAPFRIGIHLGEVLYEGGDIYGHNVNVAARLQTLAEPGGICLSGPVYDQACQKLRLAYRDMGHQRLKNMAEAVRIYHVAEAADDSTPPPPAGGRVNIAVLGGFSLATDAGYVVNIRSNRVRALLGYLALSNRHMEFRTRIAGLLCSDASDERSREVLAACLRSTKQILARTRPQLLVADRQIVRLEPNAANVDLFELSRQLAAGRIADALVDGSAAPEYILKGLEDVDEAFTSWLKVTRHNWRSKLIGLLEANIVDVEQVSERQSRAAQALRAIDQTHELSCRCLMHSNAAIGNAPAALRLFGELKERLASEFDIEPSPETRHLAERIRAGNRKTAEATRGTGEVSGAPSGRLPRIIVAALASDKEPGAPVHLLDGFRQELIASLVRFREWIVIAEGREGPLAAIANGSGEAEPVDYVLQADCAKDHSAYSVTVTFMEARSRRYVWSERYRLALENWDKAQHDIVRQIAARMGIYLSTERLMTRTEGGDKSLQAYDKWLKGEHLLTSWSPAAEREAEELFREVIDEMPQFAPAYCSLAGVYNVSHLIAVGKLRDAKLEASAAALAQRAVAIDPLDARTHLTLAWSYCMAARYDQAELHYDLAMQLNPNNPATLVSCAQGLAFAGRPDLSQATARDAIKLAPVLADYQWAYLASARFICGDYEGCIEASGKAGSVIVDVPGWKAAALVILGRHDEARDAVCQLLAGMRKAWHGDPRATDDDMIDWMLQAYPIREQSVIKRLKRAIRSASAPMG
jgi:class 3 adenylate cyclase/DNA-binding SARP family transcriptional activator